VAHFFHIHFPMPGWVRAEPQNVRKRVAGLLAGMVVLTLMSPHATAGTVPAPTVTRNQVGLASFYGPGFNGDRTASGEVFDERELVAAHRSLPLGSVVRVTNLQNGRSVVLRVIDRGPYGRNHRKGCIIDVSKGAARRLRFVRDGLTRVLVQVVRMPASHN
jgi:rare lipoprotein A